MKFNVKSIEITDTTNIKDVDKSEIICTTPENWRMITRSSEEISLIRLVIIDNVHILTEPRNGPILESIICGLKKLKSLIRYFAIATNIPNATDIANWLGRSKTFIHEGIKSSFKTHVFGFSNYRTFSTYQFDAHLTYKLEKYLKQFGGLKGPTIIFCSTRKGVESTALHCSKMLDNSSVLTDDQRAAINAVQYRLEQPNLMQTIRTGVAYYHAGLSYDERSAVERLFEDGHLSILVSTNVVTVNFNAELVIIKSTNVSIEIFYYNV